MPSKVTIEFSPSWIRDLVGLADPKIRAGAELIAAWQRARIPVSRDGSNGRPAGYARDRIAVRTVGGALGHTYEIGSDATTATGYPYPLGLDVGTRPHTITSHGDYPLRNRRTGQIFGRTVHHPGTAPTYWCRGSLAAIAGRKL